MHEDTWIKIFSAVLDEKLELQTISFSTMLEARNNELSAHIEELSTRLDECTEVLGTHIDELSTRLDTDGHAVEIHSLGIRVTRLEHRINGHAE